jgi:hypothetical protein
MMAKRVLVDAEITLPLEISPGRSVYAIQVCLYLSLPFLRLIARHREWYIYTAGGSQALFDTAGASWCGAGCGKCYELTSTGSASLGSSSLGGAAGESIIVMFTNLCLNNGNALWCPTVGELTNTDIASTSTSWLRAKYLVITRL